MKKILLAMTMLIIGGVIAGGAAAQDPIMSIPGLALEPVYKCAQSFDEVGLDWLSPDALLAMTGPGMYGIESAGGAGVSGDSGEVYAAFCTYNTGYENCGSCNYSWHAGRNGRILYREWWCLGIRVWRHESCKKC